MRIHSNRKSPKAKKISVWVTAVSKELLPALEEQA